ncbi:MAG: hypothetical protein NC240_04610 [Clostridium sp.]|nr:hypothetical protein [Clostridium sp.]
MKYGILCIIIIVLIVIFFLIINQLYKGTTYYLNSISQIEKFNDVPNHIQLANTGSSHAKYALQYSADLNAFNFALQPQSLSYDLRIIKQYISKMQKGCKIALVITHFSFCFVDYENDRANTKYYFFLDKQYILNYTALKKIIKLKFPLLDNPKNIRYIFKDVSETVEDIVATEKRCREEAQKRIEGWQKQFGMEKFDLKSVTKDMAGSFEINVKVVNDMILFCKEHDLMPVIVIPPISEILKKMIPSDLLDICLYDNINKANSMNIPILDYSNDSRFVNYDLYMNSDFLNEKGQKKFYNVFIKDMEDAYEKL